MPSSRPDIACYALTPAGLALARRLAPVLGAEVFAPARLAGPGEAGFASLAGAVAAEFPQRRAHVFVAAAGIVVRAIAPHLGRKDRDPAVLALDQEGRHVVSLLSGHLGGANELARQVAALTGGTAVITTATDTAGLPAIDLLAAARGLGIANLEAAKHVSAALLDGRPVPRYDPGDHLGGARDPETARWFPATDDLQAVLAAPEGVVVDFRAHDLPPGHLWLVPRVLALGIGCRRGVSGAAILAFVREVLAREGLSPLAVRAVGSIAAKADEPGIAAAARELGAASVFYEPAELARVAVPTPSATVRRHMGVESVCEAAALRLAGSTLLLVPKAKNADTTLAAALCVTAG